ncbi:MAG: hypothetical protein HYU64_16600 [Armatimonadetes bacterium]|nr:hypothetical protein [Armatimonadota bacterium]
MPAQAGTITYVYTVNANRQLMRTVNGTPAGGEPVLDARNLGNPDPGAGFVPVAPGFTPRLAAGDGRVVVDLVASRRNADGLQTWTRIESRIIAYPKRM